MLHLACLTALLCGADLARPDPDGVATAVRLIIRELSVENRHFDVRIRSRLPRAMGLGSSAALAVAVLRAFDLALGFDLGDERVNELAFKCEKLAHGTPSGVDNTLATFARPMLFRNDLTMENIDLDEIPPLVVACSGQSGSTHELVAGVRQRREESPDLYDALFAQVDTLSKAGARALARTDYAALGRMMDVCQGLLNALGVSTPELERMIDIARSAGAAGVKLTGAGGGGSIVALCPGTVEAVSTALQSAGYETIDISRDVNEPA